MRLQLWPCLDNIGMADLGGAARSLAFVGGSAAALPTHGVGGPVPQAALLPLAGDPLPTAPPMRYGKGVQSDRVGAIFDCPLPIGPLGHGAVAGRDALLIRARDLLCEMFPAQAVVMVRGFALAHVTCADFDDALDGFPPSAPVGMAPPAVGALKVVMVALALLSRPSLELIYSRRGGKVWEATAAHVDRRRIRMVINFPCMFSTS